MALPAAAQTKSLYWDRFDVDITVNQDGGFDVAKKQVIQFTSGSFTNGFRSIDNDLTKGITNVTVEDENGAYVQNSSQRPGTYTVSQQGSPDTGGELVLRAHLRYQPYVYRPLQGAGGLRYYSGGDQVWWRRCIPTALSR